MTYRDREIIVLMHRVRDRMDGYDLRIQRLREKKQKLGNWLIVSLLWNLLLTAAIIFK